MNEKDTEIAEALLKAIADASSETPTNPDTHNREASARTLAIDDYNTFISAVCKRANIK